MQLFVIVMHLDNVCVDYKTQRNDDWSCVHFPQILQSHNVEVDFVKGGQG